MLVLMLTATLAACGERGFEKRVNDAVRFQLTDPESARFEDGFYSEEHNFACGSVNARNQFGGYAGRRFWLYKDYHVYMQDTLSTREMINLGNVCLRAQDARPLVIPEASNLDQ